MPLYEPDDGKIIFGAWVDSEDPKKATIGVGGDSPTAFNKRLGLNAGVFHVTQQLPLIISPYTQEEMTADLTSIENTHTDAILFLTLYLNFTAPNPYDLYTDADIMKLAYQLDNITSPLRSSRRVMLRFAPEMNGNWFSYGQQPTRFIKEYKRVVGVIRSVTQRVSFVWAPNAANLYPFGEPLPKAEIGLLDTNKDGKLDIEDDPFTPYWPGPDYVDWVGISLYWKGDYFISTPPHENSLSPSNFWEQMVQGGNVSRSNPKYPFYDMFAKKYNKPLVMPEGGAAFALRQKPSPAALPAGAGRTNILQTFWRSYLNPDFFAKYPKAKMFINFEYLKIDEDPQFPLDNGIDRDFRITWDAPTLAAFKSDVAALGKYLQWAVSHIPNVDPLLIGGGQTLPGRVAGSLYEPIDGKVIFGAWVDSENADTAPIASGTHGGDSPVAFNNRLGFNAGVFHLSQQLPLGISTYDKSEQTANLTLIEQTKTDAILFLTLYLNQTAPNPYDLYTDADVMKLAYQLDNLTNPLRSARRVMLRFAPEMNGNWFTYGQQPTRYVKEYKRIVTTIRSVTPRVSFVWAPNAANLYPFGDPLPNAEFPGALDSNNDGVFDFQDDPFTPYWPGTEFVDWVGISMYWKGDYTTGTPPHDNSVCPADYWVQMVQGGGDVGSNPKYPFYDMFAKKYDKPLVMPEGGAAFALTQHPSPATLPVGAGQVAILQGFWRSYLNTQVLAQYPKVKMFINFEFFKINEDPQLPRQNGIDRDFRITWDSAVLSAFKADLAQFKNTLQWAVAFVPNTDPLKIGGGQTPAGGTGGSSSGSGGNTVGTPAKTSSSRSVVATVFACFLSILIV
ncbi:UNVERIFIED_CONTAM: hypothetical protein HDU68_009632 [Siphonaria sp. JEL0065]|nr:hypothetical protein HDU68_009632 [Siphonaria sp. JEL0065]